MSNLESNAEIQVRAISRTGQFKRDFKRESKSPRFIQPDFIALITALANDHPLADKYRDHALTGEWKDHRDCHIRPDLVLIYRKLDDDELQLVRLGSHSELGL